MLLTMTLIAGSAAATAALIGALRPVLVRCAMVWPDARSSHALPTPQGGGIAVVAVTLVLFLVWAEVPAEGGSTPAALFAGAVLLLMIVGAWDDIKPTPAGRRLALQALAALLLIQTLGSERVVPALPLAIERAMLLLGLVWFINLTNFMDGIDWMTVAQMVPTTAALALLAQLGLLPQHVGVLALALLGALLGFAPFNRHVARLFLGDVGSLPIGAMTGWMLIVLAAQGHLAPALILPMYYLADATITLAWRWRRGAPIAKAHREHFYQRALERGFSVPQVTTSVFALNGALALLALAAAKWRHPLVDGAALLAAVGLTGFLLRRFARGR